MSTSRLEAHRALADTIRAAGINAVYARPVSPVEAPNPHVAVILQNDSETEYNFAIYVVTNASLPSMATAYEAHMDLVERVDDALRGSSYGPPVGGDASRQDLDAFVYTFQIEFPRNDF